VCLRIRVRVRARVCVEKWREIDDDGA